MFVFSVCVCVCVVVCVCVNVYLCVVLWFSVYANRYVFGTCWVHTCVNTFTCTLYVASA